MFNYLHQRPTTAHPASMLMNPISRPHLLSLYQEFKLNLSQPLNMLESLGVLKETLPISWRDSFPTIELYTLFCLLVLLEAIEATLQPLSGLSSCMVSLSFSQERQPLPSRMLRRASLTHTTRSNYSPLWNFHRKPIRLWSTSFLDLFQQQPDYTSSNSSSSQWLQGSLTTISSE